MGSSRREHNFDYMRVFAAMLVVLSHVKAMSWKKIDVYSTDWAIINFYGMITRFSVPLFFMIAGRFALDPQKEYSITKTLKKVRSTVIVFVFWSFIYTLLNIYRVVRSGDSLGSNLKWIIIEFFTGEYHMWFLLVLIGLYLITPIVRKIVEDKKVTELYLLLFIIVGLALPLICSLPKIGIIFSSINEIFDLSFVCGYTGFYIMGYYLYEYPIKDNKAKILYLCGAGGLLLTIVLPMIISRKTGVADEQMAYYLLPQVAVTAFAIYNYMIVKHSDIRKNTVISWIAKYSFGCYLAHPLILWIFEWIGFVPTCFPAIISVPVIAAIAFILALVLTYGISKIPGLKMFV